MLSITAEADTPGNQSNHTRSAGKRNHPDSNAAADPKVWRLHWRRQLHRLAALDLPLLAVGAGPERKAPASLRNGELLVGWTTAKHTPSQLDGACSKVIAAGTRTGKDAHGLIAFDIDGETAVSWCLEHDCDPATTPTWQIHRNTDESRLKVAFRLSEDQQQQLGQIKATEPTKDAVKDDAGNVIEKGEAVELFHGTGQVIVLGQHWPSKGCYLWPEGLGPEALAPIPSCWWEAALAIAGDISPKAATAKAKSTGKGDWRPLSPCPICGRDTTSFCSQHRDGKTIRCFHGNTFSPPSGLRRGDEITDKQGTIWAYSKTEAQKGGEVFSVFVEPDPEKRRNSAKPRQQAKQQQTQLARTAEHVLEASPQRPASLQALIQQLPDGWDPNTLKPQMLSAGRLADMLPAAALRFNEMTLRAEVHTGSGWQRITDADLDSAYVVLSGKGWKVGSEPVIKAIIHTARQAPHHPVRAYLQQVEADPGIALFDLDQVAPQFFRAKQPLHVAMVRKWLIGAVSRALNPGCQMDYVLVLQGDQGQLKSTSLQAIASPDWYCSSIPENEKDLLLNIHSTWIYELAELESVTSRKESGRLKNLITTSADLVRVPYGRTSERMNRQSVFCATVNEDTFLRDDTGNRRFWVVPVEGSKPIDKAGLLAARDAIWKAAIAAFRAGELPMLRAEMEALSSQQNQEFNQQDPWVEMVLAWMDGEPFHRWDPDRDPSTVIYDPKRLFTSAEILYSAGLRRLDQITRADEMRVAAVLRQLKFERAQKRVNGRIDRFWLPSQPSQPSQPQGAEVVTPKPRSGAVDLGLPSQPSQPISTKRGLKRKGHAVPGAGAISQESFEKSTRGCDTLARSVAPQSFQPSQPAFAEVVTPLEVVTAPTTAQQWVEAALAELRLAPHNSHLPEVVAWIKAQPTKPLIAQAQLAGALDRLQRADRDDDQQGLDLAVVA